MTTPPPAWTGPENDYRGIVRLDPGPMPSVAVVIPVYNRVDLLERTLAGLVAQSARPDRLEVIVADDGSTEDVSGVVARFEDRLRIRLVRQDHQGFGAARARNLGAASSDAEVLLFLDADCIPAPHLIERHAWWHSRAANLVVAGTRRAIDSSPFTAGAIATGSAPLVETAGRPDDPAGWTPDDWRHRLYRRSRRLQIGHAAYRAGISSNLSVRRERFERAGGFDEAFTAWGGEDTELTWRLWNDGAFVVPDTSALVFHQVQDDPDDDRARRMASRDLTLPLIADRVPHAFYRKTPTPFATVPRVTWVVSVKTREEADRAWREASSATYPDTELVVLGPEEAVAHLAILGAASARVTVIPDAGGFGQAVRAARGELLAILDGRVLVARTLLARATGRLDATARSLAVRVVYRIDGDRYRRLDDLAAVDDAIGRNGLPLFALVRRRELLKDPAGLVDPGRALAGVLTGSRVELIVTAWAALDGVEAHPPRLLRPRDLVAVGPRELARKAVQVARRSRQEQLDRSERPAADTVSIEYVGLPGKRNLGDDAMLETFRRLMPWADIGVDRRDPRLLLVGGGTLVNADGYYLTRMMRHEAPTVERAMFGTGVRSPEFWGVTERMDDWFTFLDASIIAGVRGPDSVESLRELGYGRDLPVLGDVALSMLPPGDVERVESRVVVCPVWTSGSLWGGDDAAVFAALGKTIRRLREDGRDVVLLSAHPEDDRWIIGLMRDAGAPNLPYLAGYDDLDGTMRLLASSDLVIGERLHAVVLAAAAGTPFVAVEYRPKVRDFTRSVGQASVTVRTDEIGRLDEVVDTVLADRGSFAAAMAGPVDELRRLQAGAAETLRIALMEE